MMRASATPPGRRLGGGERAEQVRGGLESVLLDLRVSALNARSCPLPRTPLRVFPPENTLV